jgi:hypothetical protein
MGWRLRGFFELKDKNPIGKRKMPDAKFKLSLLGTFHPLGHAGFSDK